MRIRLRTLFFAVAVAALACGWIVHAWAVFRVEDDFAAAILFLEGVAGSVLLAIGLAARGVVRFLRRDDAYAAQLRRTDVPARCPFPDAGVDEAE